MINSIIQLTYDLCRIPSITGDEGAALEFLLSWLQRHGFRTEKIAVDEARFNIFAYFDYRPCFNTIFCTHIDIVAPFIEPFVDNEKRIIFGRGSCDAKGIISAMIFALLEQRSMGFNDNALLITVGEEEASDGAMVANALLKNRGRYLLIGEPTELVAASAQKGSLVFDLMARGREAHSSAPHLGKSAIHSLAHDIKNLLDYPWPKNSDFGETFINIGIIEGGSMRNVLAGTAKASCIMRTCDKALVLTELIKKQLSSGISLEVLSSCDPFYYRVPKGFPSFVAGFGSDAPYLKDVGQPILLGPGSIECAHKDNEHISFDALLDGISAYHTLAHQLRDG